MAALEKCEIAMELWTSLPRWLRVGSAMVILGYSVWLWSKGVSWPWGIGIGLMLLVLSFLDPPKVRRSVPVSSDPPKRPSEMTREELIREAISRPKFSPHHFQAAGPMRADYHLRLIATIVIAIAVTYVAVRAVWR